MEQHKDSPSSSQAARRRKTSAAPIRRNGSSAKRCIIKGQVVFLLYGQSGPGKAVSVRFYSCTEDRPGSGKGKLSKQAYLEGGKSEDTDGERTTTYKVQFEVEEEFGIPGALVFKSQHKNKLFLQSASLQMFNQAIHFNCNSWIYPFVKTKADRIFFSNTSYLPNQTPNGLKELRKEELESLRGDGTGERKEWDRIYDYDYYNDLGNPDKGREHVRPILGGYGGHPYPRRGRTGRPPSTTDPLVESCQENKLDIYVPPDERLSPKKLCELISNAIRATKFFIIPQKPSTLREDCQSFHSFEETNIIFSRNKSQAVEKWVEKRLKKLVPDKLYKQVINESKKRPLKFPLPQIIAENKMAWLDDREFGRQMLAGVNPTRIQVLEMFPPQSKSGEWSKIEVSRIEHNLEGMTIDVAMDEWRIFILDHHDYLMPFLYRINTKGVCVYASRTLLFLRRDMTLKPIAIELTLPASSPDVEKGRVFYPASEGTEAALWQLAKAHVAANDTVYHQLISHWLQTHAVVEPFIIATRRQLSEMHPVHRLLDPHFKNTMHVNALARSILINSGGILEKILFSGEISMELSSKLYKKWKFNEQALPDDLLNRAMAIPDPENPSRVQLVFNDYPYAADGLDIWTAINTWVTDFCSIFYGDDDSVRSDPELQAWWSEIRKVGHVDARKGWFNITHSAGLIQALTTLIWLSSASHAAVNLGQYAYAGYPPNRPALCRKFIPEEGTLEFAEFLKDPDRYYLNMLPERFEMSIGVALAEVLSRHTSDEEYLGQRPSEWTDNKEVQLKFQKFINELRMIQEKIWERNRDARLKNRRGPAKIPYNSLFPDTTNIGFKGGITARGIPNSISI